MNPTSDFILNQTMLRITDPKQSLAFYQDVLGMTLLDQFDFPEMSFTLYFMGYPSSSIPTDPAERAKWIFTKAASHSTPSALTSSNARMMAA